MAGAANYATAVSCLDDNNVPSGKRRVNENKSAKTSLPHTQSKSSLLAFKQHFQAREVMNAWDP